MVIYADNAATTKISDNALREMIKSYEYFGNPSSTYNFGKEAKEILNKCRKDISKVIGCKSNEIYFTSGGSESDNWAIISSAINGYNCGKTHIISSKIEHHAVLHTLDVLKEHGFDITLIDVDENGFIDLKKLENSITDKTCLVSVMYANNEIGTIQPINEIGNICKKHNIPFHTDAVQAVGHININVKKDNIDMLSASSHKFHGPKGVGFLYVKNSIKLNNLINGGGQELGKRAGTENVQGIVGMATALKEQKYSTNTEKRNYIIDNLLGIEGSVLNGSRENRLPNNINISFSGVDGEALVMFLNSDGICCSAGSACNSGSVAVSHVIEAIDRDNKYSHGTIRLTISDNITKEECDYIIEKVKKNIERLRKVVV